MVHLPFIMTSRRRRISLKMIVLIMCCVCSMLMLFSLKSTTGLQNADIALYLHIPHTGLKGESNVTKYFRNMTTDLFRKHNQETGKSNGTVIRGNYSNSDNARLSILHTDRSENKKKTNKILNQNNEHYGSIYRALNFIPNIPREGTYLSNVVPYLSYDITKDHLALPDTNYIQKITILTPIRNAEKSLEIFKVQIMNLSYPHNLISVFFGESGSTDKTFKRAVNISTDLKRLYNFRDSRVINLKMEGGIHGTDDIRHRFEYQKYRRSHLASVRNRLVRYALQHGFSDHILFIDSDVEEFQTDLVEQMLFAKSDVVATSCLIKDGGLKWIYDCNSWRETKRSLKHQSLKPPDALVLECYSRTERIFLPHLKKDGRVVKLDGVGGCALMIKADCFRSGLLFPEVIYKRHIETEGLAKMALDMGYSVVGLPFVEVFHHKSQ